MTSRDFCYWLQGYFELNGASVLTESQAQCIQKHLALVFKHEIDPSAGPPEHQKELDAIHDPDVKKTTGHDPLAHVRPGYSDPFGPRIRC